MLAHIVNDIVTASKSPPARGTLYQNLLREPHL